MQVRFETIDGVLRVEIRGRETAEQTRASIEAALAERERRGVLRILISVRESRTIFKVEQFGLSGFLDRIAPIGGLRVAVVADEPDLHAAHQYIEVLAAQRGLRYRAFRSEAAATEWLRAR